MQEREIKLAVPPGFRLPDLDGLLGGIIAVPLPDVTLSAVYHDTADLRLARAGASLRYRSDDGWTAKLPRSTSAAGLLTRTELPVPGGPGPVPPGAVDLVRAYARTARVEVVTRLRTHRRRVELVDLDGKQLAEVTDDEVSVLDGRRVALRFRELEVELAENGTEQLAELIVDALRAAGAGAPDPIPKVVRALGPRALEAPDIVVPGIGTTAADAVRRAIASSVERIVEHDAVTRIGEDPEGVHQMRVAARRLRSDLRTFRTLLEPEWTDQLREELQWLGAELGAVRDAEVLAERLRGLAATLPEPEASAADQLIDGLVEQGDRARAELRTALRSDRYLTLLDRLVAAAQDPPFASDSPAGKPAGAVIAKLVRAPWRHLDCAVSELEEDAADAALHDVRKRAKRTRYAAEAVGPVIGKPARKFAAAVAKVQTVLGDHMDAVMAEAWLRDAGLGQPGAVAFAAGALAAKESALAQAARDEFPEIWAAADRKALRKWM
jgi:CHAD domain-containing protein